MYVRCCLFGLDFGLVSFGLWVVCLQEEYETAMTEAEAAQKKAEEEKKANLKE